jgi:hypothetical protein
MTTLFLIAGFFAHLTFHHHGARGFIADCAKRNAVPLLVGWPRGQQDVALEIRKREEAMAKLTLRGRP